MEYLQLTFALPLIKIMQMLRQGRTQSQSQNTFKDALTTMLLTQVKLPDKTAVKTNFDESLGFGAEFILLFHPLLINIHVMSI